MQTESSLQTQLDTRSRLLEAAASRVHEQGFFRTSLDEIAGDVNIAKATFYYHFKNKEELGRALIDYYTSTLDRVLQNSVFKSEYSGLQRLQKWRDFVVEEFRSGNLDKGCPICNLISELSSYSEEFRRRLSDFFPRYQQLITTALEDAAKSGEIQARQDFQQLSQLALAQSLGTLLLAKAAIRNGDRSQGVQIIHANFAGFFQLLQP